jgi:hypothetical protein
MAARVEAVEVVEEERRSIMAAGGTPLIEVLRMIPLVRVWTRYACTSRVCKTPR